MTNPKIEPIKYMQWLRMVREALAEDAPQARNSKLRLARKLLRKPSRKQSAISF
jgi:hypothetical protein